MCAGVIDSIGDEQDRPLRVLGVLHVFQSEHQRVVDRCLSVRFHSGERFLK
jgi:hypothetical protein